MVVGTSAGVSVVARRFFVLVVVALVGLASLLAIAATTASAAPPPSNGALYERWDGITGSKLSRLTNHPDFPDNPDFVGFLTTELRTPTPERNVGQRVRAFYTPPATGDYVFAIASDNQSELYLSTDASPANASLVAYVPRWTNGGEYDKFLPEQQSSPIPLIAGEKYYLEVLHKNDNRGSGHMTVAARRVGAGGLTVIPAADLMPWTDALLGDRVWEDINGNGTQDGGEPGIAGVPVNLFQDDGDGNPEPFGDDGAPVDSTSTSGDGSYGFAGVPAGDYFVEFGVSGTFVFTAQDVGDDSTDSDANPATGLTDVFTYSGGLVDDIDAGAYHPAAVGDRLWHDLDGDGKQDGGEPGLPGVQVSLLDDGMSIIATTTTGPDGVYLLDGLTPGTYYVDFPDTTSISSYTAQNVGSNEAIDSDVDSLGKTGPISLTSAQFADDLADAGFYYFATIGDFVWDDVDQDGIQDGGEPGVDGVTLQLKKAGVLIDSTVTAGGGLYEFTGVPPGNYRVKMPTVPAGKMLTLKDVGGDDSVDSDGDPANPRTDIIAVVSSPGQVLDTWDFGLVPRIDPPMEGLFWERWTNIPGSKLNQLLTHPDYPNSPDQTTVWMGDFEFPGGTKIGDRVRGFVVPSVTDDYTFWIASDNQSRLFLSSDADPANLMNGGAPIASVPKWTNLYQWTKFPEQQSVTIHLEAGKAYYIEALHKQDNRGSGHFEVAWSRTGDPTISVIDQNHLWVWKGIATIDVAKLTDPAGGTGFDFIYSMPDGVGAMSLDHGDVRRFVVPAGVTYTVSEADPGPDWQLDSLTCSAGGAGSVVSRTATITVDDGDLVLCTWTNTPVGADLSITKTDSSDPVVAGGTLTYTITVDNAGPLDATNVVVTDTLPAGVTFVSTTGCGEDPNGVPTCTLGTIVAGASAQFTVDVTLDPGTLGTITNQAAVTSDVTDPDTGNNSTSEDTTVNEPPGTINIVKATTPAGGTGFTFTDDIAAPFGFTLDHGQTETFTGVAAGTYTVVEGNPPGYKLTDLTCVDSHGAGTASTGDVGTRTATINLEPGETVTCTFTNTELGTVRIVKDAVPDGPEDFLFTGSFGSFNLDDDGDPILSNTRQLNSVMPGTYTVTEADPTGLGYVLDSLACDDGASMTPSTTSVPTRTATINLDPGETVTCTFTNVRLGTITIVKDTVPDGPQDFAFSTTGGLVPATFDLDDDIDGTLSNTWMYTGVIPGAYTVTESAVPGYTISIGCVDPSGGTTTSAPTATISLAPGETVTCTFTNTFSNNAPMAGDDQFDFVGNTSTLVDRPATPGVPSVNIDTTGGITALADGVLDNDTDAESDPLTVTMINGSPFTSGVPVVLASGAQLTMFSDGTFSYEPPLGFAMSDSFTYEASDGVDSDTATVQLQPLDTIWYVDNSVVGPGTGTAVDPFKALVDGETAAGPATTLFVFEGDSATTPYDNETNLDTDQAFIGEGVALIRGGHVLLPAGNQPVLTVTALSTNAVVLGNNNDVAGIKIDGATATGLLAFNTLQGSSMRNVDIVNSGIDGFAIVGGTAAGTFTFDAASSISNSGSSELVINGGPTANVTFEGAISKGTPGTFALRVFGPTIHTGTIDLTASSSITASMPGKISFENADGVYNFAGSIDLDSTGGGIDIASGSNGQFTFSGPLDIDTTGGVGTGFFVFGPPSGPKPSIVVTGSATMQAGGGQPVHIRNATIGAAGITFDTINKTGTTGGGGVLVDNVDGGLFDGGTVDVAGTSVGGHGISIVNSPATFTFDSARIANTDGAGINLAGANGQVTFTTVAIDGTSGVGIGVANNTNPVFVDGGSIGAAATTIGDAVDIDGGSGNITFHNSITNSSQRSVDVTNRTGGAIRFIEPIISDTGLGIRISGNDDGDTVFTRDAMLPDSINISLNTGANPAFEMDDNDGVGISVIHEVRIELGNGTLDIDTTSGRAFSATNGGQLRVVGGAAGSRTIDSTTGQALMIDGIELIAPGVGFTRVAKNSATGATTGITISNMIYKDGIVDIGNTVVAGTDAGFEGILISDLTNTLGTIKSLKLRNLDIDDTGADGIKISNLDDVSVDVRGGSIMNVGRNGIEVDNGSLSFWDAMISGTFPTFDGIDVADDIGEDAGLTDNLHIRNSTIVGASRGVSITVTNHGVMNDGGRVFALIETSNITGGSDEILASASSIVDPSTICLNAAGNTLDGGSGVISLSQSGSGFLSVHQSVAGTPGTGVDVVNGIPMGNVVTAGTITYDGSACIT